MQRARVAARTVPFTVSLYVLFALGCGVLQLLQAPASLRDRSLP